MLSLHVLLQVCLLFVSVPSILCVHHLFPTWEIEPIFQTTIESGPWIWGWQNCNSRAQKLEPHLLIKVHSARAPKSLQTTVQYLEWQLKLMLQYSKISLSIQNIQTLLKPSTKEWSNSPRTHTSSAARVSMSEAWRPRAAGCWLIKAFCFFFFASRSVCGLQEQRLTTNGVTRTPKLMEAYH